MVNKIQVPGDLGIYVVTAVLKGPSYVIQSTEWPPVVVELLALTLVVYHTY